MRAFVVPPVAPPPLRPPSPKAPPPKSLPGDQRWRSPVDLPTRRPDTGNRGRR